MDREQWVRVKEIFNGALEREPAARAAFVAEAAAGDDEVRAEAERLLDAQTAAAGFIERAALPAVLTGRIISHYEVGPLLGTGGMGGVYAARLATQPSEHLSCLRRRPRRRPAVRRHGAH